MGPGMFCLLQISCSRPSMEMLIRLSSACSRASAERSCWMRASEIFGSTRNASATASARLSERGAAAALEIARKLSSRAVRVIRILFVPFLVRNDGTVLEADDALALGADPRAVGD